MGSLMKVSKDLALRTAAQVGADYVLAQDPDADRFAAAEKGWLLIYVANVF